jgi:RNA polymerase sigma factor (sigma-70 family)
MPAPAERRLVLAAKRRPGPAREQLIELFTPLLASVARTYRGMPGVDRGELMQEGVVGLLRALERYDPCIAAPFWCYASWWVRQAMQQLVAELTRPVVLSDRAARQLARVKDARTEHVRAHGHDPRPCELADETGLSLRHVEQLIAAERRPRALDEPVHSDDDSPTGSLGEQLADPEAEDAYDRVSRSLAPTELPRLLTGLTERERGVVVGRFGLEGSEQTLRELGERLGVSVERVRQIEERALDKLREAATLAGAA